MSIRDTHTCDRRIQFLSTPEKHNFNHESSRRISHPAVTIRGPIRVPFYFISSKTLRYIVMETREDAHERERNAEREKESRCGERM